MKEPDRRPLDPSTPRIQDVEKRPLLSLEQEANKTYPEPMTDDTFSEKDLQQENLFFNFIQKAKDSKKKYEERLEKISKEAKESS